MKETVNIILLFFLALVAIAVSRSLGDPQTLGTESREVQAVLSRPVFKISTTEASVTEEAPSNYLQRKTSVPSPEVLAGSTLVQSIDGQKIFLNRASDQQRPIASITKLVTATVVLDTVSTSEKVVVSQGAFLADGNAGGLHPGEVLSVEALLHAMLLESSNDAAVALAEHSAGSVPEFVRKMNEKITRWGLTSTNFTDPAGLEETSLSTAKNIAEIVSRIRLDEKYAPLWTILQKESSTFFSAGGTVYSFENNNIFVEELPFSFVGGKTGYTQEAGESLVVVVKSPDREMEIVYIVLGSSDRFEDARTLIDWVKRAFVWEK